MCVTKYFHVPKVGALFEWWIHLGRATIFSNTILTTQAQSWLGTDLTKLSNSIFFIQGIAFLGEMIRHYFRIFYSF